MKKRLVLVDGHAVVFRAYYAFPPTLTTKTGEQINAVYGFASIVLNVIRELKPTHVAVAFDLEKPTFRHLEYVDYKAQRPEVDEELIGQLDRVKEIVQVLNMPIFAVEGFEADDVIGTLSRQARDTEVVIVTGDQDAMQLVNDKVKVYVPARKQTPAKIFGSDEVKGKYGLLPLQIIDMKALMGDSSDNIPGVKGVGPKTAVSLLQKYENLEGVYQNIDKIEGAVKQKLVDGYEDAVKSKMLATIVLDVPITYGEKECELKDYDKDKAVALFEELGFNSLIKRMPGNEGEEVAEKLLTSEVTKAEDNSKQMGLF